MMLNPNTRKPTLSLNWPPGPKAVKAAGTLAGVPTTSGETSKRDSKAEHEAEQAAEASTPKQQPADDHDQAASPQLRGLR
jgi:hypothetical protein